MGKNTAYFLAGSATLAAIILYMLNKKQHNYIMAMNKNNSLLNDVNGNNVSFNEMGIYTENGLPIKGNTPYFIEDTRYRIRKTPFMNFEKDFVRDFNSNVVPKQPSEKVWNNYSEILSERQQNAKLNLKKPIYL